jgi:outer membrane immunogenic protein
VTTHSSSSGAGVGIHGGYNWQSGPWVFGGEADWSHSFINGGHDDVDMFSARARAGWAFASAAMIYATAGIATENRFLYDRRTIGTTTASFSDEQQHLGPIVGGGLDTMLGKQISVRGEVLYFIGSREQYNYPAAGIFSASSVSSTFNQIIYRAGATYHFN